MTGRQKFSLDEVAVNNGSNGNRVWIIIRDLVYDVTDYMNKHPGGSELITEYAGKDATDGFDDFGHSTDAEKMLKDFLIGELIDEDKMANRKKKIINGKGKKVENTNRKQRRFLRILCGKCTA